MNQREHAAIVVKEICDLISDVATPLQNATNKLEEIVSDASNAPPDGQSDGSISAEQWQILRDYVVALRGGLARILAVGP